MGTIYDQIRKENIAKYGTDIDRYGPVLLANLYSDKTHFVYELLQNAEDACERARKKGIEREFFVNIQLFPDRLEVRHNGIEFDERDVKGICGLVEGTKSTDLSQIGKFGIGFKSVYAYTKSPEVYSGDKSFTIKNYVQPYAVKKGDDLRNEETLFVIPFDHDKISSKAAFSEIKERLRYLGLRTLLFLRNIKEISWRVDSSFGRYSRETSEINKKMRYARLSYEEGDIPSKSEEWLIFEKPVTTTDIKIAVEVAYLLRKGKDKKKHVIPAKNTELVVFFPTQKETHLKFLIQGPYRTTPARDNIPSADEWNQKLIRETSLLITESISKIKETNLLDVSFLTTLPLQKEDFPEKMMFKPILDAVKTKLSGNEALLPSDNGEYVTAKNALLARGEELRSLLSSEQLTLLFNKENAQWLDRTITQDKTPALRTYAMQEIGIPEIDPTKFAKAVTDEFIKQQSDSWLIQFYGFLLDQQVLWRKKSGYLDEGPLRSKKIIRLEDNEHSAPFDSDGKPLVYLPSRAGIYFSTVKENIASDQKAKEFLQNLGLRKIDRIAGVTDIILPKYMQRDIEIAEEDNIRHVKWIARTLTSSQSDRRRELMVEKLKETPFLQARNINSQIAYKKPTEVYLGGVYTKDKALETYFEGNDTVWFLDERYTFADLHVLKEIGCRTKVWVTYREPDHEGNVTLVDEKGLHERGKDGFDPDCEIDGLEYALKTMTIEKSVIIWSILKEHYKRIYGIAESSTRRDYTKLEKEAKYSKMGELLVNSSWLPDKNGNFHKPSELLLSDLSDEFDKESLEARYIAENLQFKKDVEQELLEHLPDERKALYERIRDAPDEMVKKVMELLEKESEIREVSPHDIHTEFKGTLAGKGTSTIDGSRTKIRRGIHPDEEERIRIEYGNELLKRLRNPQVRTRTKISTSREIVDESTIDPKEFLFEQYGGHCQICNTVLDLGSNRRPYFEVYRIVETRGKNWWTDNEFNVLCLCPNCHVLVKHGGRDLKNIFKTAEKILNNEISPEEIDERNGDFYIVKVIVAGKERGLFYSPRHMGTLAAFIGTTKKEKGNSR
ncbi:MAG: hypothetical protein AYK19_09675 [Theionarchaea archaeon DG-70-1]|nr:MAG: hypothetical protein AYK19_09675 [Theionarchaea archaeon DG-70-1]